MNVQIEEVEPGVKKIHIEIPANRLEEESEAAYRDLGKRVKVPGFRKGKVPRSMMERLYSHTVLNDVANRVISTAYLEAIRNQKFHPVNEPTIENVRMENNRPLSFTATVEVLPHVEVGDFSDIEVTRRVREITDEVVQKELERIRESNAQFAGVDDRPIREEDLVRLDYEGKVDGEPVPSLTKTNQHIRIHTGDILKDFYSALVGLKAGEEADLRVALPKEFPDPMIAGKEVQFHVKIHDVREKVLLDLDDDFASQVSELKTLGELKQRIREDLEKREGHQADREVQKEIMVRLGERFPFDIPEKLIDRNAERMAHNMENQLRNGGVRFSTREEDREKFVKSLRNSSIDSIREEVFIHAISDQNGIRVDAGDVDAEIESYARHMNENPDALKKRLAKDGSSRQISRDLLIKKTYDFIRSKVKIKEEHVPMTEGPGEAASSG